MKIQSAQFVKGITGDDDILRDRHPQVAFVGRSNVGKSSLINALLNARELARTGAKPGKTTEINFFLVNEKYYFVDLPGYGYAHQGLDQREVIRELIIGYITGTLPTKTKKEAKALAKSMERSALSAAAASSANPTAAAPGIRSIAVVLDGKVGLTDFDRDVLDIIAGSGHRAVLILSKSDKLKQNDLSKQLAAIRAEFPALEVLPYSSVLKKGSGAILERLIA